jgi:hypothetical protein
VSRSLDLSQLWHAHLPQHVQWTWYLYGGGDL